MKNQCLNLAVVCLCSVLTLNICCADPTYNAGKVKTFVLKITSPDHRVTRLFGSFMTMDKNATYVHELYHQVTPYETVVETTALGTMVMSDEPIKVEVMEREGDKMKRVLSGAGRSVVSLNDGAAERYIYAK